MKTYVKPITFRPIAILIETKEEYEGLTSLLRAIIHDYSDHTFAKNLAHLLQYQLVSGTVTINGKEV